jgi:hypothetical protein
MANYMNHLLCWIPRLTRTQASKFGSTYAIIIETLRYTRARDHGFYAAREGRGGRPRMGGPPFFKVYVLVYSRPPNPA